MKVCTRCNINQEDSEFYKGKGRDGLGAYCKSCCRAVHSEYRRKQGKPIRNRRTVEQLLENKTCNKCKINKPSTDFRIREEKKEDASYWYINSTCKKCDAELTRIYYNKRKHDTEFRAKNAARSREYCNKNFEQIRLKKDSPKWKKKKSEWENNRYHRKKDEIAAKNKIKRQTPEYKAMMRAYRKKNKEKIYNQEVITKRRYAEKHRDNITDEYVIRMLIGEGVATRESLKLHPELIQAKRIQILIKRQISNYAS